MLIFVKDYNWRQTEDTLVVRVPLKGVHNSKVDVFTSDKYLKAHYPPFIFEVFLLHTVNDSESRCTLAAEEITFELVKSEIITWDSLDDKSITKKDAIELKKKIIEETQVRLQKLDEQRSTQRQELKRVAVRKQIALDSERLSEIDKLRNAERNKAMVELEKWKKTSDKSKTKNYFSALNKSKIAVSEDDQNNMELEQKTNSQSLLPNPKIIEIETNVETSENKSKEKVTAKKQPFKPKKTNGICGKIDNLPVPIPLPRKSASINITFTERVFPTPLRESKTEEEQEWLTKQAEARRCAGFVAADLRPEERDPQWLKDKGDSFFKQKNYLGAVSAYGHGIKLSPKFAALYVNRSAAHFQLGNFHKTIEDCSTALELLTPPVPANLDSRAKCFARRGAAFCKLGIPSKSIPEFQAALRLQPNNENLKIDIENARLAAKTEKVNDDIELYVSKH